MWVEFRVQEPGNIVFEMTIRMTLGEWTELKDHLGDPPLYTTAGRLRSKIREMVSKGRQYWVEETRNEVLEGDCGSPERGDSTESD